VRTDAPHIHSEMTYTNLHVEPISPTDTSSVGGGLAGPLLLFVVLVALSHPVAALSAVLAVVVVGELLRRGLAALVVRSRDHVRELSLPGGTVRFRIIPR